MKKIITVLATTVLLITGGTVAHAGGPDEDPTNVVFWKMNGTWETEPTPGNAFPSPQDFHSYGKGKDLDTEPRVDLECGEWYQVDAYVKTHPFGPGDKLTGPPMDAPYHQDPAQWRFVYGGECPGPTPEPTPTPTPTPDPTPEPDEETRAYYGASSCVPGVEGLAIRSFGVDTYVDGELVESKSWTEHVSDPGCALPGPDPQEDVAPPAAPVEAEATFTG